MASTAVAGSPGQAAIRDPVLLLPLVDEINAIYEGLASLTDDELREARDELAAAGVRIVGATDHGVTHSLYIEDPDGNEIELYIDVQPARWKEDPGVMFSDPVARPLRL